MTFPANDRSSFDRVIEEIRSDLAAVIMEPCRYSDPEPGFLEYVRKRVHAAGALLIFDEITIGWRLCFGGSHLKFGVEPDISVFAKALGNGHPMAAVIGTSEAMEGAHISFISSTYWTESVGPVAALATLKKMTKIDVPRHVHDVGQAVMDAWKRRGTRHGLPVVVAKSYPCLAHFDFQHERGNGLRTLYTRLMLERGFLAGTTFYPTLAHNHEMVGRYEAAIDQVFERTACLLDRGAVEEELQGSSAQTDFVRLL